jgi:hypothetical protein
MSHTRDFILRFSPRLKTLEGLEWIDSLESLDLLYLDSLESLAHLNSLKHVKGDMNLEDLWTLKNYDGLENLEYVEGNLSLEKNYKVEDYNGFASLKEVGSGLDLIRAYEVKDLSGFKNLEYIGDELDIGYLNRLKDLSGMDKLTHIGALYVYENDSIKNLNGLEEVAVSTAWVNIFISDNSMLEDISSIGNFNVIGIQSFRLLRNPSLSLCAIESVCTLLDIPGVNLEIFGNGIGCNSVEEIQTDCVAVGVDGFVKKQITVFPNPTRDYIQIEGLDNTEDMLICIYDAYGRLIFKSRDIQSGINMSDYLPGIYTINIFDGKDKYYSFMIQKITY